MAKDDFRRDENTYFGIPIETTEQLDEIRKALKSIEPLVSKLRDDFRAEKGNEQSRSDSLKDGLSKVFFGIKDVEDLLREGKAVDEKTVLKLFKTPIQDIFKDVSASQLILEKKGKERGFEFTERDLETLMMKSVKLASTVLTRVPKFGGQRPSEFKQSLNKTIEAQNELVFKKRMDAIQAEQDRIEELKKQDAKNRIAEEDLKRAEKAKVDADKKQRRLENKKSSVGVVSDEEKSALKSNREKYIKLLADYDEKLATFNKTQSDLEKNLKTANRVVKEAMETDRIFSQDLRPIGDFGHILQRMFKRYIKYEDREEIQQETDLGKLILHNLVEAITAQYGFLPTPMDLASKDLYFNKEKEIKLINTLGEVLEGAKEIMKSPIHPGRRPVNPHIRRGWVEDKVSWQDKELLKVFNSKNRKQAVEEYEQELDKEYREGKESQIDDEEIVEAIEDFVEAVVEAKEAIADLSESNKTVSEAVVKTTTNQIKSNEKFVRTVIYGPNYVPPPHRAYTSPKPATAPQGTTSTAPQGTTSAPGLRPTLSNLSLLPPMPGPAQPPTPIPGIWDRVKTGITDRYESFKQDSAKAKRDRYTRWAVSQFGKGKSVAGGPSDLTRFGMWAGDQAKRGVGVAESVGRTVHNIADTASGGSLDDKLIQSNALSLVLKEWGESRDAGGKSGGLLLEDMAMGIGAIVVILKKLSESSPILKAVLELFNLGMTLFFMPFGNMLGEWLLPLMMDFVGLMVNWNIFMSDLPAKLGEWFSNLPGKLMDGIKAFFGFILLIDTIILNAILSGLKWFGELIFNFFKWWFTELPLSLATTIYGAIKWLVDNLVNTIKGIFGLGEGGVLEGVGNTVGNVVGAITGFLGFAEGGYVPARPGGTPIIVGEGGKGEYIVPEGSAIKAAIGNISGGTDGASVTVNISGNVYGVDDLERTIKRAVDDSINKSRFR